MSWDLIAKARVILLYGATASGKSELAEKIAQKFHDTIIINGDSKQVYRELPIITAQPTLEKYHRLYSIISTQEQFSVAQWLSLLKVEITLFPNHKILIVGGTGLYLESMMRGLSFVPPVSEEIYQLLKKRLENESFESLYRELIMVDPSTKIFKNDKQRLIRALGVLQETGRTLSSWQKEVVSPLLPEGDILKIWLKPSREDLYQKINARFLLMLEKGAVAEVDNLIKQSIQLPKIIGLEEIAGYLQGGNSRLYMVDKVSQKTRNYAKRQETWFKNRFFPDLILS